MSKKRIILFILIIFLSIQVLYAQYDVNLRQPEDGDIFLPGDDVDIFCSPKNMWYSTGGVFELYIDDETIQFIRWWDEMDFNYSFKIDEDDSRDEHTIRVDMRWSTITGEETDSEEITIYVDKSAPTVQIIKPVPREWYNDSVDIVVNAQDDLSGIDRINVYRENGQLITSINPSGIPLEYNNTAHPYNWSGDNGSNTIYAVVYDTKGRSSESEKIEFYIAKDTTNISIDSPADQSLFKGNESVEIKVCGTDMGTGIQNIDLFINDNLMRTFNSAEGTYNWSTPTVSGIYEIKATAFDFAGHSQSETINVIVDADIPVLTGTPSVPGNTDGFINTTSVRWEWPAATDNSQSPGGYVIAILDDRAYWVTYTITKQTYFIHEGENDRTYTCYVTAFDAAGNYSPLITSTITVDTVAADPIFPDYPYVYTDGDLTVTWEEGEDLSGNIRYEVNLTQGSLPPLSGWLDQVTTPDPNTGKWTYTFSDMSLFSPSSIWIRSVDRAGNVSDYRNPGLFPHFTLTMPDSGEITNQPIQTFTFTPQLNLNPDLFQWRIVFSKSGSEPYNSGLLTAGSFTYTLPSDGVWYEEIEISEYPEGSTIPAVTHRDTFTFTLDTVPPDICSFIITSPDDTEVYSTSSPANTNLIHISDINAADAPSEASSGLDLVHIYYGNSEDIPGERITLDSSNIPYQNPVTWTLPETDGLHTMQMAAIDKAGNITRFLYTIALDMTLPLPPVDIFHTHEPGKTIFNWNAGDPGDLLIEYICVYTLPDGTEQTFSVIPDPENRGRLEIDNDPAIINKLVSLEVSAVDWADNVSTGQRYISYTQALPGKLQLIDGGYDPVSERMYIAWELTQTENAAGHVLEYGEISGNTFIYKGTITPDESFTFIHDDYAGQLLIPHGEYAYRLLAYNDGGDSFYDTPFPQVVPNNPPMIPVIISPEGYVRESVTFVWEDSFDYDDDPLTYTVFYGQGETPLEYSEVAAGMTLELEDNSLYSWYVQVNDGYEMIQSETIRFTIDATPPEIITEQIVFPYTNQEKITITVFDGSQTGSSIFCRMIDPETNTPIIEEEIPLGLNNMGEMEAEISLPQGYYHLFLMTEDRAGNMAQRQISNLRVDYTLPVFEQIQIGLIEHDGAYCAPQRTIPISFRGIDDFSGVLRLVYTIVDQMQNPLGREMAISLPPGVDDYAYTISGPETGITPYYIRFSLCDAAGNLSEPLVRGPFITDTSPPDLSFTLDHTGLLYYGTHYYTSTFSQLQKTTTAEDAETGIRNVTYALCNNSTGEILVGWDSWETITRTLPPEGIVCHIACKAENHAKMITVKTSVPFIIDTTPPENMSLTLSDNIFVPGEPCFITIHGDEPESTIKEYWIAIGTTAGDTSLSALVPGNRDGKIVLAGTSGVARARIIIPDSTENTYYVTFDAINSAGLTASAAGPVFTLSTTAAKMIVIDYGLYTMFGDRLTGSWRYTGEETIRNYLFRIIDEDGRIISPWNETPNTTQMVNNLSLENGKIYYFEAGVEFTEGGYSEIVKSRGITVDTIPPEVISLEVPSYATSDNVYMEWEARDLESGITEVYAAAGSEPGESDISGGWIPVVLPSTHFSLDIAGNKLVMETGTWCYITLRTVNGSELFTEKRALPVMIDNSPPPVPSVVDQGDYINTDQILEADWIFTHGDPESGTSYEWAITDSPEIDSTLLWQEIDDKKVILHDFEHLHEHTYYFCVRATNGAGLTSTGMSNGIMVDATAPYLPEVRIQEAINLGDPDGEDLTYITDTDNLGLWIQSQDPQSPVDGYVYRWGTLATIEEKEKLSSSSPQIVLENPDIPEGEVTYFSAECTNQALLVSGTGYSHGVVVDTEAPIIDNVFGYIDSGTLVFVWDVIPSVSPVVEYEVALVEASMVGLPPDNWISGGTHRSIVFDSTPLPDNTYHLIVRGCNAAGTWSRRDSDHDEWGVSTPVVLDRTPPVISNVNCRTPYAADEVRMTITAQDTLSGVQMAYYALGTDTDIFAFSDGWIEQECNNGIIEFHIPGTMFPHNARVIFTVMVKDGCGLLSNIVMSDTIFIDKTPPVTFSVIGPEWTQSAHEINGISFSSLDGESGVTRYEINITSEPGENPVYVAENTLSEFTGSISGFTLIEGGLYYIGVRTENSAGLWSAIDYSAPFRVDTLPPLVTFIDTGPLVINTPPEECSFSVSEECRVFISYDTPGGTTISWENNCTPGTSFYTLSETDPAVYVLTAYAVDPAGNRGPDAELTIRINAPPVVVLPSERYIAVGEPAVFEAAISDVDGYPTLYAWDFGDTGYSTLESPVHTYTEKGEYTLTLSVTDNDGTITTATMLIVVGNTIEGVLYVDQIWSGIHHMTGDVTVPSNRTLTILPDTRIIVDTIAGRNDYFHALIIEGTLIAEDEAEGITFTSPLNQAGAWQGILVSGTAELNNVMISHAQRGIGVFDTAQVVITTCLFEDNETGIHVYNAAPRIETSTFRNNKWYGIKEDNGAMPMVMDCLFIANRRHYYHQSETSITIDRLNTIENNSGNREE